MYTNNNFTKSAHYFAEINEEKSTKGNLFKMLSKYQKYTQYDICCFFFSLFLLYSIVHLRVVISKLFSMSIPRIHIQNQQTLRYYEPT